MDQFPRFLQILLLIFTEGRFHWFLFAEGALYKYAGRRMAERYVLLFDNLIILTKVNTRRGSVTGPIGEYKLKEKFNIRKIDIADREDSEGI